MSKDSVDSLFIAPWVNAQWVIVQAVCTFCSHLDVYMIAHNPWHFKTATVLLTWLSNSVLGHSKLFAARDRACMSSDDWSEMNKGRSLKWCSTKWAESSNATTKALFLKTLLEITISGHKRQRMTTWKQCWSNTWYYNSNSIKPFFYFKVVLKTLHCNINFQTLSIHTDISLLN